MPNDMVSSNRGVRGVKVIVVVNGHYEIMDNAV